MIHETIGATTKPAPSASRIDWDAAMALAAAREAELEGHDPADAEGWATAQEAERMPYRFRSGGGFILDTPADPRPIWGQAQEVAWAEGEP